MLTRTLLATALLLAALPIYARSYYYDYVHRGGVSAISSLAGTSIKVQGSYPGASVTIYQCGTSTLAAIYTTSSGTTAIPGSVVTASSTGFFGFWHDLTCIKRTASGGGLASPVTIDNIPAGAGNNTVLIPAPSGSDDYQVVQDIFTAAIAACTKVEFQEGTYLFATEAQVPVNTGQNSCAIHIFGSKGAYSIPVHSGTVLKATNESMRSVLAVLSRNHHFSDLWIDADDKATYGIFLDGSSFSTFERVGVEEAEIDCWITDDDTGTSYYEQIAGQLCGMTYCTSGICGQYSSRKTQISGTATITSASTSVPIAAGTDLTTLGIRKGDIVRVGAALSTSFYGAIESVNATTITLQTSTSNRPTATLAAQEFAIGVGDGFHHIVAPNDNVNTFIAPFLRGNGGSGMGMHLSTSYGDTIIGGQFDLNNFFALTIGSSDNLSLVDGATLIRPYTEGDHAGSMWVGNGVENLTIDSPLFASLPEFRGSYLDGGSCSIQRKDYVESLQQGAPQNFLFEMTNDTGTLKHKFVSEHFIGNGTNNATKITGASLTLTATPSVNAGVAFAAGAGISSATPQYLLLNTANAQSVKPQSVATIEFNSTGTQYLATVRPVTIDVNGVNITRTALLLTNPTSGAQIAWDTTTIPAGTTISVRFNGKLR
jgi:hypothetical protein